MRNRKIIGRLSFAALALVAFCACALVSYATRGATTSQEEQTDEEKAKSIDSWAKALETGGSDAPKKDAETKAAEEKPKKNVLEELKRKADEVRERQKIEEEQKKRSPFEDLRRERAEIREKQRNAHEVMERLRQSRGNSREPSSQFGTNSPSSDPAARPMTSPPKASDFAPTPPPATSVPPVPAAESPFPSSSSPFEKNDSFDPPPTRPQEPSVPQNNYSSSSSNSNNDQGKTIYVPRIRLRLGGLCAIISAIIAGIFGIGRSKGEQ